MRRKMWSESSHSCSSKGSSPLLEGVLSVRPKSETMIVTAPDVASDTPVSAERESTDTPVLSGVADSVNRSSGNTLAEG